MIRCSPKPYRQSLGGGRGESAVKPAVKPAPASLLIPVSWPELRQLHLSASCPRAPAALKGLIKRLRPLDNDEAKHVSVCQGKGTNQLTTTDQGGVAQHAAACFACTRFPCPLPPATHKRRCSWPRRCTLWRCGSRCGREGGERLDPTRRAAGRSNRHAGRGAGWRGRQQRRQAAGLRGPAACAPATAAATHPRSVSSEGGCMLYTSRACRASAGGAGIAAARGSSGVCMLPGPSIEGLTGSHRQAAWSTAIRQRRQQSTCAEPAMPSSRLWGGRRHVRHHRRPAAAQDCSGQAATETQLTPCPGLACCRTPGLTRDCASGHRAQGRAGALWQGGGRAVTRAVRLGVCRPSWLTI